MANDLTTVLNCCTEAQRTELRKRLDRPSYIDLTVPTYDGALARRTDLILRTENLWRQIRSALRNHTKSDPIIQTLLSEFNRARRICNNS